MSPDQPANSKAILPAYLDLAARLRADIASGRFAPGAKLPSETQLMMRQHVSRSVAKWAIAVLKADGLVDGRQGAGIFVRTPRRLTREPHHNPPAGIPRQHIPNGTGHLDPETHRSEEIRADATIAARLAVTPGDTVLRTTSRYLADGVPLQLITSWQPIGTVQSEQPVDQLCERVIVRPASPDEILALALRACGSVLAITRTYTARSIPV